MKVNITDPAYQTIRVWIDTCNALVAQEMPWRGKPDSELLSTMLFIILTGSVVVDGHQLPADVSGLRAWLRASAEWKERHGSGPEPGPSTLPKLHTNGKIFRDENGGPWRWKGVTAFGLINVLAKGGDVRPFLRAYKGYNVVRTWPYVRGQAWAGKAWDVRDVDTWVEYIKVCASEGFFVECTLLTDDGPDMMTWAKGFVTELASRSLAAKPFIEGGNEPQTHKNIKTRELKAALDGSRLLYASGDYEDESLVFGKYGVAHTGRTSDWTRRAHDLMEYYNGAGPRKKHTAIQIPWVADEPGKHQDVGTNPAEWRAYFGACALFGAGATFHSETGKYGQLPTELEQRLAKVALDAMNAFPADAPLGAYKRHDDPNANETGRTYSFGGKYMVRCQQRGLKPPDTGWEPLDDFGVLFRKKN